MILQGGTLGDEDFVMLLEDRAFVDYFNIYSCLPIFGQHVVYNFIEREFSYEPPIKRRKNFIDRKQVVRWLCTKRFPGFSRSCLFLEYILCRQIRDVELKGFLKDADDPDEVSTFSRNLLGSVIGMLLFRESFIGTPGEKCFRCWLDLERLQRMPKGEYRQRLLLYIRNMYLSNGAPHEIEASGKHVIFEGKLNFDLIPEEDLQDELIANFAAGNVIYRVNTEDAFKDLQRLILTAIRTYWVPRYLMSILRTTQKAFLAVLKRRTPYEKVALASQRQMRCRLMFPTIYDVPYTPTKAVVSKIKDDMKPGASKRKTASAGSSRRPVTPELAGSTGYENQSRYSYPSSSESSSIVEEPPKEHYIDPNDFLSIAGGGRIGPKVGMKPSNASTVSLDFGSSEPRSISPPQHSSSAKTPSFTTIRPSLDIPPSLAQYISGNKRIKTGKKLKSKVMCALASDCLAGNPMQSYLNKNGQAVDEKLLEFWKDVRQYLDADDSHRDEFGTVTKSKLAHQILDRYLSSDGESFLPESVKMTLLACLSSKDDSSLFILAQDIITENLKATWKLFLSSERKDFKSAVCGEKYFDRNVLEYPSSAKSSEDPLMLINTSQGISPEDISPDYRPKSGSIGEQESPWSRNSESADGCSVSDEQLMRAFELTVVLEEYGRPGMFSYQPPTISDIIDVIYSDYGSLHINKIPVKRHYHLHKLMYKPKFDIANLKVSREVMLDRATIGAGMENDKPRGNRLVLRRDGLVIDRPPRPRCFNEVLNTPMHYEFFKRFMTGSKMPYPLAFWKNIEELREMAPGRMRVNMTSNIHRKYFSKAAKQGALLDCTDDIIRQIPSMEKVPMSVLLCAQNSVYRAMERKWYPKYLETFPTESDYDSDFSPSPVQRIDDFSPDKPRQRKIRKGRTLQLWQNFISVIVKFVKAMRDPSEIRLLDLYVRKELYKAVKARSEKERSKPQKPEKQKVAVDKSSDPHDVRNYASASYTNFYQARVVLKNRLIILDKLPMDVQFWVEVNKYVGQVDHVKKLENVSQNNVDFLQKQAYTIVDYHLASEIPPRNQLNIPSDLATSIILSLEKDGATRGLFHDALILLFPVIYHYWRQCQKDWLKKHKASELLAKLDQEKAACVRPSTPHKHEEVPDFLRIRLSEMKITTMNFVDDDSVTINFSLLEGCRIILPAPKLTLKSVMGNRKSVMANRKSVMASRNSVMGNRNSVMGNRKSVMGRKTALEKDTVQKTKGSGTNINETSQKKENQTEKDKKKSRQSKKMDSLSEDDSPVKGRSSSKAGDKKTFSETAKRERTVEEMVEESRSRSRLRNMDLLVNAAVQENIDQDLFGEEDSNQS